MTNDNHAAWQPIDARRHELGEGARFIDKRFYYVDLLKGRLYAWDGLSDSPVEELVSLDVPLGAVARDPLERGLLAAAGTGVGLLGPDGTLDVLADFGVDPEKIRVNDAVLDSHGCFWVGTMAYEATSGQGTLFLYEPSSERLITVREDITIPNGPAFSADGSTMYLADTQRGTIFSFTVDRVAGALRDRSVFALISDGSPDGMTVAEDGDLWCAIWGGSRIDQFGPAGRLKGSWMLPVQQPTSVAITYGPEARIIVTSASIGLGSSCTELDGATLTARWPLAAK